MVGLDRLVPEWFKRRGLEAKLDEHRLLRAWPEIVGPQIARHAWPTDIRAKTLRVVVDSSPWLHQLTMLKPVLLEKVGRQAGLPLVRDVRFVIGEVPPNPPVERADPPTQPAALTPDDEALLEDALAGLTDPELKASARRLIARALATTQRG